MFYPQLCPLPFSSASVILCLAWGIAMAHCFLALSLSLSPESFWTRSIMSKHVIFGRVSWHSNPVLHLSLPVWVHVFSFRSFPLRSSPCTCPAFFPFLSFLGPFLFCRFSPSQRPSQHCFNVTFVLSAFPIQARTGEWEGFYFESIPPLLTRVQFFINTLYIYNPYKSLPLANTG